MKTTPGLPRSNSQCDLPLKTAKAKHPPATKPLLRAARSWSQALDTFDRELPRLRVCLSASGSKVVTRAVVKTSEGSAPEMVTFVSHDEINRRFNQQDLWVPPMNGQSIAVLYRFCGMLIVREAEKTYSIDDATQVIKRVLKPMQQLPKSATQMPVFEAFLANVLVLDEGLRESLKAEQRVQNGHR